MAIEIQVLTGDVTTVIDGGFVDGRPAVYGGTSPIRVDGAWVPDVDDSRFDADGDWTGDSGHVYAGLTTGDLTILGGYVEDAADVFGSEIYILPAKNFRWIQLEGGGRKLFEAVLGDEAEERYFELRKNGRPFPLVNVSNPIFSWLSPSGSTGEEAARIVDDLKGRVGVHLFAPLERGVYLVQVRYVDDVNLDSDIDAPDEEPPYAPVPGAQELWRQLPKALRVVVSDEGGWL